MRPVARGPAPRTYRNYGDAIDDLELCLGSYCSYCERFFPADLAVEHVSPKSLDPARELDWSNFLIACKNCNSAKANQVTNDEDFLWPDKDNTMLAIDYGQGGLVVARESAIDGVRARAIRLIELVGLDRHPGQPLAKRPRKRDKRYKQREVVRAIAIRAKDSLAEEDTLHFRWCLSELAKTKGFFSVWMAVFSDDSDMRRRLFEAFDGTAINCFDENWQCIQRPGGRI